MLQVDILKRFKVTDLVAIRVEFFSSFLMVYLVEVLHGLDVVVGEAEPGEQVDVLQPLDGDQVVRRQVKNLAWQSKSN